MPSPNRKFARAAGRWLVRLVALLAIVAAIAAAGGFFYLRSSLPSVAGKLRLAGLTEQVEIIRDANGVPHIFAASADDAFFALGFVHAQDRLAQMELMRLTALGRLAEVVGEPALDSDRFMRTLGFKDQVERDMAALSPAARTTLEAYARGVNAYLLSHHGAWPPEFLLTGERPGPWRPQDSLLWGKLMALQLTGNWRDEMLRARLSTRLPVTLLDQLWPSWPAETATTLPALAGLYRTLGLDRLAAALPPPLGPNQASNEWVVAGTQTDTGKPLLVNDPHLTLGAPSTWYLARITAPGLTLTGATAPGVPAVVLGHNGRIAWGFTTTNADVSDLFVERIDPDNPSRYLTPEGPQPFAVRSEIIKIKDGSEVTLNIRSTRHGVVISDLQRAGGTDGHVLALALPSLANVDRTAQALFALNRAGDWAQFTAALRDWQGPVQNIVYADTSGNIGLYTPGLIPRRSSGDGWLPQPGWTGEYDWAGFVGFDELPHAYNPTAGRIVNANNRIVPEGFPVFISRDWESPYRAQRIADLLTTGGKLDRARMGAIVTDPVSLFAREIIARARMLAPSDARAREALTRLAAWDGAMRRDRPEPLIFNTWMRQLTQDLLQPWLGPQAADLGREQTSLLQAAFREDTPFCDSPLTETVETCGERIIQSLRRTLDDLGMLYGPAMESWRWDAVHFAPFRHPFLSRVPVVRDLIRFHVPSDGDYYTINRGASRTSDPLQPFAHVHGATLRAIYDLSDLDASLFILAPGQSGNPLSAHWGDLAQRWADGGAFPLAGAREALRAAGSSLTLTPP
jgi:penicillin amidase